MLGLGLNFWCAARAAGGTPQIITADTAPTMAALTDAQTPADGYTAGSYSSTAGTIASAVATYYVNGNTGTSSDDLDPDDTVYVSVLVTDSEGNTRTFTTATVTVGYAAPVAAGGLSDLSLTLNEAMTPVDVSSDFTGQGITYALAPSSGALPAGLSLSSAGSLSGTPTEEVTGRAIVIRGTNSGGFDDSAFSLTVAEAATITLDSAEQADGGDGVADTITVNRTVTGSPGTLTYYMATGGASLSASAAQLIAGSGGTDTTEFSSVAAGADGSPQPISGFSSASTGAAKLAICASDGTTTSNVLTIDATGLDFTAPAISGTPGTTSETTFTVTFTEAVYSTNADATGFTFTIDATGDTITGVTGWGTDTLTFTCTSDIANGDALLLSYASGSGDVVDGDGNPLASFTDQTVTNNVAAAGLAYTYLGEYEWNANSGTTGQYSSATSAFGADGTLFVLVGLQGGNSPKNIITSIEASGKLASVATDGVTSAATSSANVTRAAIYKVDVLSTDSGIEINLENATDGTPLDALTLVSARLVLVTSAHSTTDVTTAAGTSTGAPWTGNLDLNTASGGLVLSVLATSDAAVPFDTFTGVTQLGTDHNSAGGLNGACVAGLASDVVAATPRTVRIGDTTTSTTRYAAVSLSLGAA